VQCAAAQSLSYRAVELYFTLPYIFMVWCLMTEGHLPCYVTLRMCKDVDWIYLAYSRLQCQAYVHVVVNTEFP
jgi:hypothetical protein